MNIQSNTKALVESSLMAVIGVILAIVSNIPFLSILLLIWPLPFIILGVRQGLKYSFFSIIISSIIIFLMFDPLFAMGLLLTNCLLSLIICRGLKKGTNSVITLMYGAVAWILSTVVMIALFSSIANVNIVGQFKDMLKLALEQNVKILPIPQMDQNFVEQWYNTTLLVIPSAIVLVSIFISFINYLVASLVLNRIGIKAVSLPPFYNWKLPDNVNIGIIVLILLSYLLRLSNAPYYETVTSNLIVIFSIGFIIQGLAIIAFFLRKKRVPNAITAVILVMMFLFIGPFFLPLLVFSTLDVVLDYRKIRKSRRRFK